MDKPGQKPKGFCWLRPGVLGGTPKPDEAALKALSQRGTRLPSLKRALQICREVSIFTARSEAVVFHCHAGKGRTGTMLAAMLIWMGQSAEAAIAETRGQNKAWIETGGQLDFLANFSDTHHV